MRESTNQNLIRAQAPYNNCLLWRNNVGVLIDKKGRPVRFGLANDSKELNEVFKSSDLIGITKVFITPSHVGRILGVFTAEEIKETGWVYRESDERAVAQKAFHDVVLSYGGYAGFATSIEDHKRIIGHVSR